MADPASEGVASLFSVPGLFVGFCSKGSSDCDSAKSPTSPLELRAFPFARSPRSPGQSPRSWESSRVGLGLVDSLNNESKSSMGVSESKRILFGSQMRMNTISSVDTPMDEGGDAKSLPNEICTGSPYRRPGFSKLSAVDSGEIHSWSGDMGASSLPLSQLMYHNLKSNSDVFSSEENNRSHGSPTSIIGSMSASEIEQSEDYTCIICHGPNPKTTHIFGDCILDGNGFKSVDEVGRGQGDFLSFCFTCKKKLEEGKDIYIFGGEKAFCSCECREQEIMIEEGMGKQFDEEMLL